MLSHDINIFIDDIILTSKRTYNLKLDIFSYYLIIIYW